MKIISLENQNPEPEYVEEVVDAMNELILIGETQDIEALDNDSEQLVTDLGILEELKASIEAHGITESITDIFGASLEGAGVSMDNPEIACEGIMDSAKAILRKIWEFIMKMVAKVKDFFAKRFGKFAKYEKQLKARSKALEGADAKVLQLKDKDGKDNMVKAPAFGEIQMKTLFAKADGSEVQAAIAMIKDAGEKGVIGNKAETMYSIESEKGDDDVTTYKVSSKIDEYVQPDRKVADICGSNKLYIDFVKNAQIQAKDLGSGKLYSAVEKEYNKISAKAAKAAKSDNYSKEAKAEAANSRNAMSAANKAMKLSLVSIAKGMGTLISLPIGKPKAA